jgi:hypothetical protein
MSQPLTQTMPVLYGLPITLPRDGAVQLEFEKGVLIFRASQAAQDVVEKLLGKQSTLGLSSRLLKNPSRIVSTKRARTTIHQNTRNSTKRRPRNPLLNNVIVNGCSCQRIVHRPYRWSGRNHRDFFSSACSINATVNLIRCFRCPTCLSSNFRT